MKYSAVAIMTLFSLITSRTAEAIVNGVSVNPYEPIASTMVALQMQDLEADGTNHFYHGSAVVVGSRTLLTAAHNLFYLKDPTAAQVITTVSPVWDDQDPVTMRIRVKAVQFLPGFKMDESGTSNDLAVIGLSQDLPSFYKAARIATDDDLAQVADSPLILAGYGMSKEGPLDLRDLRLRRGSSRLERLATLDAKLWFSGSPSTIAGGDSGGAAFGLNGAAFVIYGIAIHRRYDSSGKPTAECAFTDLTVHRSWIEAALRAFEKPLR